MRLWWTALLVVIALAGAGLAVAADRPHNPNSRPELTWRADRAAQPWISALVSELEIVDAHALQLSRHGRDVLGRLTALDVEGMNTALAAGDPVSAEVTVELGRLAILSGQAEPAVEEWRLGPSTRARFDQLGVAAASAQQLTASWQEVGAHSRRVGGLIDSLFRHDGLVFRATTAGRNANWDDALLLLEQAKGPLGEATEIRNGLATRLNTDTLDDLLDRYRSYDAALTAMYAYIRDTGLRDGPDFDVLEQDVATAQEALPPNSSAMRVIVAEAAGPPLTDALVAIEAARGEILEALEPSDQAQP